MGGQTHESAEAGLLTLALCDADVAGVVDAAEVLLASAFPGVLSEVWLIGPSGGLGRAGYDGERALAGGDEVGDAEVSLLLRTGLDGVGALVVRGALEPDQLAYARKVGEVLGAALGRARREEGVRAERDRLVEAQRISGVGSYDFEIATNINTWSDQLYRIYGREPQSFNASYEKFMEMLHPDDRRHVAAVHQQSMATLRPYRMEERVQWPDGQQRTLASWGEVIADDAGTPTRMVGICWDITEQRELEARLLQEALHDRLTGLPNRTLLVDRLEHALATLPRRGSSVTVLFIDVDRFKVINDSLGHDAGDEVLIELARRLSAAVRPGDTVARFGGDEFVVLTETASVVGEVPLSETILDELSRPIAVRGSELVVSVSIGVAQATTRARGPHEVLRDADAAMYRAKDDGRGRSVRFAEGMHDDAKVRLDTETDLRRALAEGQLQVHYQPVLDLQGGHMVSLEALVRWQHPTRGLVQPSDFVPVAEETGLVVPLGEWVVVEACRQLVDWRARFPHLAGLTVAVNVSGVQLARPDYVNRLTALLADAGFAGPGLELEITETVLMRDAARSLRVLHALRGLGVRLAIDDFGTGYSSLSYLKRLPVDTLKIDRSFIAGLGNDPEDSVIVSAVVALATSLGMTTIAEGAETAVQLDQARALGCTKVQGFFTGRPTTADELDLRFQEEASVLAAEVPQPRTAPSSLASRPT